MTMITTLDDLRAASPELADRWTTAAGAIAQRIEQQEAEKPPEQRLTGPEKKALAVSVLETNLMAVAHALNASLGGNNPLVTAGINLAGPALEEIVQAGYEGVCWLWASVSGLFEHKEGRAGS